MSATKTVTLEAGATLALAVSGRSIFVDSASQKFLARFDNSECVQLQDGYTYEQPKLFSRLELTNPNAAALAISFLVSEGIVTRTPPVFMREAVTTVAGAWYPIAISGVQTIPGAPLGKHRKEIILTNDGPNHSLIVYATLTDANADTARLAKVYVNQSMSLPTSATLYVRNSGGVNAIDVYALEVNYA